MSHNSQNPFNKEKAFKQAYMMIEKDIKFEYEMKCFQEI